MAEREARERPELNEARVPGWTPLLSLIDIHKVGVYPQDGVPGPWELCGMSELLEWIKRLGWRRG